MKKLTVFVASALLALGSAPLHADEVTLTTGLAAGENLTLALNADLALSLTWGNGETEQIVSDGSLISLPVKDAQLTITTTQGDLKRLYVQGNKLTALTLTNAPKLTELYAADNQLTELSVGACPQLTTLDLQGNQLTALNAKALTELKDINVANNQIASGSLQISSTARPEHYVVNGNALSALPATTVLSNVKALWAAHNALTTANLSMSGSLRSLCLSSNKLTSLTVPESPLLQDLWVENNSLKAIDLSKGSPVLVSLAADHNQLHEILWDGQCRSTFLYAYLNDNALFINSMPPTKISGHNIQVNHSPMEPYVMDERVYELETLYNWSDLIGKNGWGLSSGASYSFKDGEGQELAKGTDFSETSKKFKFKTGHANVVLTVESSAYEPFRTAPFNIGVPDAIQSVAANGAPLRIQPASGGLSVEASQSTPVSIYSASGLCIANKVVGEGTHSWTLPAGIYLVNGVKVLVR